MQKFFIATAGILCVAVAAAGVFFLSGYPTKEVPVVSSDPKNLTYRVEGSPVTLVDGKAETPVTPDSASKIVTTYFGNEAVGDLNTDGLDDTAFILTQSSGGSGTFYYVAVALSGVTGYTGTNAVLLGDRIAPQSTEIEHGELVVNYAERKPEEPMTAQPSVGVSKHLHVVGGELTLL